MTPFEKAVLPPHAFDVNHYFGLGLSPREAEHVVAFNKSQTVWLNDLYQVAIRSTNSFMWHLSIKRIDKQPIHDWRHLQQIKNELVGPENEAVELYPAESRLVDGANQFHLWCLKNPSDRFPVGWDEGRKVSGPEEAAMVGAVQRPFE